MARNLATTGWGKRFVSLYINFERFVDIHSNGKPLTTIALPIIGLACAAAESVYSIGKEREILKERERDYQRRLQLFTSRNMKAEEANAKLAKKWGFQYAPAGPHKTTHG